jgi:hypothetical protein
MSGVTYDTGALVAADRGERRVWSIHRRALERSKLPIVPAAVLGQAWRRGPQPDLSRLLAGCQVESLSEATARAAGTLMDAAGSSDLVDATVVVGALKRGDAIVSADRSDIAALISASGEDLVIVDI